MTLNRHYNLWAVQHNDPGVHKSETTSHKEM